MPEAACFNWRATWEWVKGAHARSTIDSFFRLGEEQTHRKARRIESDHPERFALEDEARDLAAHLAGYLDALSRQCREMLVVSAGRR